MNDLGALYTRIEADTKGLNKAESHIKAFATRAAASLAAVASVAAVTAGIKNVTMLTARYDTLGIVMDNVGKNAGYNSKQMAEFEKSLQKTGISMIASRETISKMTQAQIDLTKSSELARVAQDAAVIGNINSSEAFQRMIQGIQSAEVEILRGIGINVSFEESYKELAAQLKKNVADLSTQEKTQARVNSVLKAGAGIQGTYAASMNSAGKQWLSLQRYVEDTQVKLGRLFQPSFSTIVKEITEKLKKFSDSLDEKTLKDWSEKLNDAAKGTLSFANSIGELSDKFGTPGMGQIAIIGAVLAKFGPQAALAATGTFAVTNAIEIHGDVLEKESKKSVSALVALQRQYEEWIGIRKKGTLLNPGEIYSEVEKLQNQLDALRERSNQKKPWSLFPDPHENKRHAEQLKNEIKSVQDALVTANLKEVLKKNYVDPWLKAAIDTKDIFDQNKSIVKRDLSIIQGEYEKHRDAIFKINDQIKQNKLSGDQLVRDLKREGMSKGSAEADLKKEAQEYVALMEKAKNTWEGLKNAKSKEDVAKKDAAFEDIIKYADVAQSKFLEMDRSSASVKSDVIKNIQGIVAARDQALNASKQVEVNAANALIKESDFTVASQLFDEFSSNVKNKINDITAVTYPAMGDALKKVWLDGQETANLVFTNVEERAKSAGVSIGENLWAITVTASENASGLQIEHIQTTTKALGPLMNQWGTVFDEATRASNESTEKILSNIARIKSASANSSPTQGHTNGGAIQRLKDGGMVLWNKMEAIRASTGKFFAGFGGGDKIPILGEAGEYMINKYKVREAGVDTAAAFNTGNWAKVVENLLPKLRLGGPMPSMFPRQALAFGGGVQDSLLNTGSQSVRNYYINGSTNPISVSSDDKNATMLLNALKKAYKGRSW